MSLLDELKKRFTPAPWSDAEREEVVGRRTLVGMSDDGFPSPQPQQQQAHGHVFAPPAAREAAEVQAARSLLQQTEGDPARQLQILSRILEKADHSDPHTAGQLLELMAPFGREYPAIANLVASRRAELRQKQIVGTGTGTRIYLDEHQAAEASAFNAKHAENVAAFVAATGLFASAADVDVQQVATWQAAHKLAPDGKIGAGTVATATAAASTSSTTSASTTSASGTTSATTSTSTSGTTSESTSGTTSATTSAPKGTAARMSNGAPGVVVGDGIIVGTPDAPHEPPAWALSKDPDIAAKQKAMRKQMYEDDPKYSLYRPPVGTDITLKARYLEIRSQRRDLPRDFIILMVGQTAGEQGVHSINFNYFGMEGMVGKDPAAITTPWTRGFTSYIVEPHEFDKHPEKFFNWPGFPDVATQRAAGHRATCGVFVPRPAYATMTSATAAFIGAVMGRYQEFKDAGDPNAALAWGGTLSAYIKLVNTTTPKGTKPYNAELDYPDKVTRGVTRAKAELADVKDPP